MINLKNIEHNLSRFNRICNAVKVVNLSALDDTELAVRRHALTEKVISGTDESQLIVDTFALVCESIRRTLGITVHDNQMIAAAAMCKGLIIELATGEGKTLAAVFTACLKALSGKGVHVLTFNDYLAKRDAEWMKPVYKMLGLEVSYIVERSDLAARQKAYRADITYVTAREAGFDYLRGFLSFTEDALVHKPFNFAIVDEADSMLIDESRIPLVVTGDSAELINFDNVLYSIIRNMRKEYHFNTDENGTAVYLEEAGVSLLEEELGLEALYDETNLHIAEKATLFLQAEHLLKRDIDYIVRNGEVLIVDEFTGRVALRRQWSEGLHAVVEYKEGLSPKNQGKILNSITLQNFMRLYPDFAGMTGTACSAAGEFLQFYDKCVAFIPPNIPCARVDHPDLVFTNKVAKYNAVVHECITAHKNGRPILIGTASIEESELLAELLHEHIPTLTVLNAKNDELEAEILAEAGALGSVTISTNMAGRGVDIRLGGKDGADGEAVRLLGGLYVIGTNRHESVRVDNQLRGRAGRQGDVGESRFFVSLEDNLFIRYGLLDSIPVNLRNIQQDTLLKSSRITKAIVHTQKVIEGQMFDAKVTLNKYESFVEKQRQLVSDKRAKILLASPFRSILEKENFTLYENLLSQVGQTELYRAERLIVLFVINTCWSNHLLFINSLQEEAQLIGQIKGDPLTNYHKKLIDGFAQMERSIRTLLVDFFVKAIVHDGILQLEEMGIHAPTSTRSFMVHDGTENQSIIAGLGNIAPGFSAPLLFLSLLMEYFKKRKRRR